MLCPRPVKKPAADIAPSARDRAREARTGVYREHILDAAESVFAEAGFEAAKLQDISKRAALSMGTIYAIFPGKAELLAAILERRGGELLALARAVAEEETSPAEMLNALIAAYVGYFVEHPTFLRMHLRQGGSWILTPSAEGDERARIWNDVHAAQAEIFRRGVKCGAFAKEDPSFLSKLFAALDQLVMADWVATGMKATRADLTKRLQQLVLRTLQP